MSTSAALAGSERPGRHSIIKPLNQWYIACRSEELRAAPKAVSIFDTPLVLFRGRGGKATALLDRCAHRNVPLSIGKVVESKIECAYHGWRYDTEGLCRLVPSLCGPQEGKARRVAHYPTREQQGFVWVFLEPDVVPDTEPFTLAYLDEPGYARLDYTRDFEATMHATFENILDVPHTAFLHRGLFRGARRNRITAVVRRTADMVEAEYIGEPRPQGVVGRVLAPQGGAVEHYDRFILPCVAQVEYRLGKNHLLISNILTPISDYLTRMYATVTVRLPLVGPVLTRVLRPVALRILDQDAVILRAQTEAVRRFGGEQYVSTAVDLLGPHILRLLKQIERKEPASSREPFEERVEMLA